MYKYRAIKTTKDNYKVIEVTRTDIKYGFQKGDVNLTEPNVVTKIHYRRVKLKDFTVWVELPNLTIAEGGMQQQLDVWEQEL